MPRSLLTGENPWHRAFLGFGRRSLNEDRGFGLQCQEKEKDICHKGARELPLQVAKAAAIPRKATEDALHITLATVHGMDYLLTWNCKHIGEEGSYLSAIPNFATVVWNGCKEIDSSLFPFARAKAPSTNTFRLRSSRQSYLGREGLGIAPI